jgi:hypothetical protein
MKRVALAIAAVTAACGGAAPADNGRALYAKKVLITWGIEPGAKTTGVFLAMTDEAGKQTSYPLGDYDGECRVIKPALAMQALSAVACSRPGGPVVELDASVHDTIDPVIIILKSTTPPGADPDPMVREEVRRVVTPPGSKVEAGLASPAAAP